MAPELLQNDYMKNQIKKILMVLVVLTLSPSFSWATMPPLDSKCYDVYSQHDYDQHDYSFCIDQEKGSTSQDVLLYLHGAGGSEHEWVNSPYAETFYSKWGMKAPTVISISYGKTWLLVEKNDSDESGLYEHFTQIALPHVESMLLFHPAKIMLVGASMGGFNASQLYLKQPQLFSKVALACPALFELDSKAIYSDDDSDNNDDDSSDMDSEVSKYVARTRANEDDVNFALGVYLDYFPDEDSWNAASPIDLAAKWVTPAFPPLYVSCGDADQFGFFEGSTLFTNAVTKNGASAELKIVPGPHCSFDQDGMFGFLMGTEMTTRNIASVR